MPLNQQERIKALVTLKRGEPDRFDDIIYNNDKKRMGIYKIPFEYLVFNKYNGRILSMTKSYERQFHELNPSDETDAGTISDFLWESKEDRNKNTSEDLKKWGQKRYGIVTKDGVIIDGNRRASILIRNYKKDSTRQPYFLAVILDDVLDGIHSKEIMRLETTYQMGEDEKLDYNPIEKYLKCKQLIEAGFNILEIADMMSEKEGRIREWLEIMELMDDYLDCLDYTGIYTRLEKREGQFVDLNNYLKKYKSGTASVLWNYDKESDVSELKLICFDYIRAQYEGKDFRSIAKPGADSFFCNKNVWETFKEEHFNNIEPITSEEQEIAVIVAAQPNTMLPKLLKSRDETWTEKAKESMQNNLAQSVRVLNDVKDSNAPKKLITRAIETLRQVNTNHPAFF